MENRFGLKDLILTVLILGVIGVVLLAMWQYDRQLQLVLGLQSKMSEQTEQLTQLAAKVDRLSSRAASLPAATVTAAPPATPTVSTAAIPDDSVVPVPTGKDDPFATLRAARAMPGFKEGDWYIEHMSSRVGKITPLVDGTIYSTIINARVLEPLLCRDPETLEYKPLLAERYEIGDGGLSVTYHLRKGVTFSDGQPLTAKDVIYTFDMIMNPQIDAARTRSYLQDQGTTWTAPDDYTVKFTLKKPYFELLNITGAVGIMPAHFYSKYKPTEFNESTGLLMGSGPYRLATPDKWKPGKPLELVRNERYWGVRPAFNKVIYREVEDETAGGVMFTNGELDYFGCVAKQFNKLKADPEISKRSQALNYYSMLGGYTYIAWNQKKGEKQTAFADKRVRQAMTMLIDRSRIAEDIYGGYARVANGPFSRSGLQSNPDVKELAYDPDGARKLLAEAGFVEKNGLMYTPEGKLFKFELMFPGGSSFSEQLAVFMKNQLVRGGITVDLRPTDFPVLVDRLKKSDFEACTLGWTTSVETDLYQIFHSSQVGGMGDNRTFYKSAELDATIEKARATVDAAERMKLWQRAHAIIAEDQPYTFLVERQALRMASSRIANIKKARMGLNFMTTEYNPLPWYSTEPKYTQ